VNAGGAAMLEISHLTKRYPGVLALNDVSLSFAAGQVHALVGENGAGKSTLLKVLSGVIRAEAGEIRIGGEVVSFHTPRQAQSHGVGVVHQHSHLIPYLTVAENYALRRGYPRHAGGPIDWGELRSAARVAGDILASSVDVNRQAASLGTVEQRLVELSFALAADPRILILDEPTAVLPYHESRELFARVKEFAARGGLAIFVSHRLNEVFEIADNVAVLRDGAVVWTKPAVETNHDDLIQGMVGRSVTFERDPECVPGDETLLGVQDLSDHSLLRDIGINIRRGEIYGIYGLVGSGQPELAQALFGIRDTTGGMVELGGEALSGSPARERVRRGLAYVPADRLQQGLFGQMTVGENASIAALPRRRRWGLINRAAERKHNEDDIRDLRIRTLGVEQNILQLSGGNQQKVLLSRWLQTEPRVLVLEEPTQGVDVGAKGEIHRIVTSLARKGVGILLITSEIPELLALSHRIGIMSGGRLVTELDAAEATEDDVLRCALPDAGEAGAGAPAIVGSVVSSQRTTAEGASRRTAPNQAVFPSPRFAVAPHSSESAFGRAVHALLGAREAGLALMLIAATILCSLFVPAFATWRNLQDIIVNQSIVLVGALGMMLVIISGNIDISCGAILGLAAVAAGKADLAGLPAWECAVFALGAGLVLGLLNGAITVAGRIHSIVVTLGTMFIFRGAIIEVTGGKWLLNLSERVTWLGQGKLGEVPLLLIVSLTCAVLIHLFLRYTVSGRRLYALGGDSDSAAYMSVYPRHVVPLAFALAGLLIGFAGLLHAGRYGQVQTNIGQGYEMKVIAAAVIGGTHIMGGRGSALGTLFGALFMGLIANILTLTKISAFWEGVVVGGLILAAILADTVLSRRRDAQ
jgi:rhamnose transport system ATP-binding protein